MPLLRKLGAALLCALLPIPGAAVGSQGTAPAEGEARFLIFIGGRQVGQEQVSVARSGGNWIIAATGQLAAPAEIITNRFELKYAADWQPLELHIEATTGGKVLALSTSFGTTTAVNEITHGDTTNSKTDQISAQARHERSQELRSLRCHCASCEGRCRRF